MSAPIVSLLEEIAARPKGNARFETAAVHIKNSEFIRRIFIDTLNPFVTFGVQKFTAEIHGGKQFYQNDEQWATEMFRLGEKLASRELTGHAAQTAIALFRADCNYDQLKWGDRYLLRDLRLDLGAKSIQKIVGKNKLPLFEVPLATDYTKAKKLAGNYIIEPKYDGARVVAFINSLEDVVLKSRTGKVWQNFKPVEKALLEFARGSMCPLPYVVDGEVVALDENDDIDFQKIQKVLMSKEGLGDTQIRMIAFDGCRLEEWMNPQQSYEQRLQLLDSLYDMACEDFVLDELTVTEWQEATSLTEYTAVIRFRDYEQEYVSKGFEGAIARRADNVVQNKRTTDILKIKSFTDDEAEIIGYIEGTGKFAGTLGALICRLADGKEFDMGSGMNDKTRDELWEAIADERLISSTLLDKKYISVIDSPFKNKRVTFKFFEKTNDGKPRFPIFKSLRSIDDIGTKVSDEDEAA